MKKNIMKLFIGIITLGFIAWAALFIYQTSFIAIDGKRYFCLFDDAMISMRYAWNFAHGFGLVWNPGERVQGYTNLLMVLIMSFANFLFNKPTSVLFIQIMGLGIMLLNAYLSTLISDHLFQNKSQEKRNVIKVFVFFCALSYYPLAYWTLMGMETGLLTFFLLLSILLTLHYAKKKNPMLFFSVSGYLGLAYLTRNDSLIFAISIWLFILWEASKLKNSKKHLVLLLKAFILYVLFVAGQGIFQYLYYGEWLPNTYTLKLTGMSFFLRINNGVGFVTPFVKTTAIVLFISIADLIFDFQRKKMLLLSIVVSSIAYQIYVGGDPWNYWRIMSPTMPLLFIVFIDAVASIIKILSNTSVFHSYFLRNPIFPRKYAKDVLIILFLLIGVFFVNKAFLKQISFSMKPFQATDNHNNVNIAIALNELTQNDASVGVYWAGSIPYYTDKYAIDFLGKSDKHIAELSSDPSVSWNGMNGVPGHNKYDLNYSIKLLTPTYVQGFRWGKQNLSLWAESAYVKVDYKGVSLFLLQNSPDVLWSKIDSP